MMNAMKEQYENVKFCNSDMNQWEHINADIYTHIIIPALTFCGRKDFYSQNFDFFFWFFILFSQTT